MTEPASTLGTFGLQAFGDFAFLLPPNLYVLAPSRLNAYNTLLPSLVDRPFRATDNVPLFYVEEEPYFAPTLTFVFALGSTATWSWFPAWLLSQAKKRKAPEHLIPPYPLASPSASAPPATPSVFSGPRSWCLLRRTL
ncbi:hypothetical protein FISHEDRAFT_74068 [Fistulina hepatica ATCC 64428]|uniref:Uncharacterized protein n=1 Tax=Fistulina hepatica ATCC 64428 TaxID=1128425 RepID=A0A0D7ABH3_9AGAR|nr:hypothetical protein FISHEDRAFT_74068 [Fistulina hepatica ATCC 64428]